MPAAKPQPLTIAFNEERETKGTVVFVEEGEPADHKIGKLYIKKSAIPDLGFVGNTGRKILVTISAQKGK